MTLYPLSFIGLFFLLSACVSTGDVDPLSTKEGRSAARDAYVQLGIGYLKQGETERAKIPLSKALKIDPDDSSVHAALAIVFQLELEPALADEHYQRAISLQKDNARLLNNYGSFLFEQKRYTEAYVLYKKAAEDSLYSKRSHVFENLGFTAQALGLNKEARIYFERALRLNSKRYKSLLALAQLAYANKEYILARNYYEKFSSFGNQTAPGLLLGSQIARKFSDPIKVSELGSKLKHFYPASLEYKQYLAEL